MTLLAAIFALIGFASLALGMERHHRDLAGRSLSARMRRRIASAGWCALALSCVAAVHAWGVAVGIALWLGLLSLAATMVLLAMSQLAYRRQSDRQKL